MLIPIRLKPPPITNTEANDASGEAGPPNETEQTRAAPFSIYNSTGERKYLNSGETRLLLQAAARTDIATHSFVRFIVETGCRISEALAMRMMQIDLDNGIAVVECLKKRRSGVFRTLPISPELCTLIASHCNHGEKGRIWPWTRMTAWRKLHQLFDSCGLDGARATPRGLRHGFATAAVSAGVPLPVIQRWMGHSRATTTAIYVDAVGHEARAFAKRLWRGMAERY